VTGAAWDERHAGELLRDLAPRVLGVVARRCGDFAAAEDALQEALLAATLQWPRAGLPQNPRGWLTRVALRRLTDEWRSAAARRRREARLLREWPAPAGEQEQDDTLTLLFMCCHPALTPPSAVALTLRAVGGLTTAEIARAFLVPEATMAQRVSRAKQSIKASKVPFQMPTAEERAGRLDAVLHVLYLIFNEGYAASSGQALRRDDLASEAIRLTRALWRTLPHSGAVTGLLALMLLTDARRAARQGPLGELIPLDEQDRSLWDRAQIAEGEALVAAAFAMGPPGEYVVQAAIAALHDEAARVEDTDWPQILALYDVLLRLPATAGNPMAALGRAVAVAMVHGPSAGLAEVAALEGDSRLAEHHRLDAVCGHLLERAGQTAAAVERFARAAERTTSMPERSYLLTKAARLREQGAAEKARE
jgi:RNA polymerase sigma factor (sigma-70 family)